MSKEKWYQTEFGKTIGEYLSYGILAICLGIGGGYIVKGCDHNYHWEQVEKYKIDKQEEFQRLRTLEELTRAFGSKMTPEEFKKFLEEYNLNKK